MTYYVDSVSGKPENDGLSEKTPKHHYRALDIKPGDTVLITSGNERGKKGKVLEVSPKEGKVIIEGCNMVTKHTKQSPANPQGGIVNQEAPIDISNVMLVVDGKATRVGFEVRDGKKVRVAKKTGKVVE